MKIAYSSQTAYTNTSGYTETYNLYSLESDIYVLTDDDGNILTDEDSVMIRAL